MCKRFYCPAAVSALSRIVPSPSRHDDLSALAEDIAAHGLQAPLVAAYEIDDLGKVVDLDEAVGDTGNEEVTA